MHEKSAQLYQQSMEIIPGGVNSPVRAFKGVGGTPVFMERGEGPYLFDVDENQYIDYVGSWGPLILGHQAPEVLSALQQQLAKGITFGTPSSTELDIASEIHRLMPNMQQLRFVNSGTEATMTAIRLARAFTKHDKIIKFEGCYHGHSDCLLVKAGSGALTLGVPSSPGVPAETTAHTLTARFNDLSSVERIFATYPQQVAAIIVEPIAGNMNFVPGSNEFLSGLKQLAQEHSSLLIFDEVMSGFRVGLGGAQAHYDIAPDLTCLGKIIGGGLPVGAFGGRKEIMSMLAPSGPVYQAGTLSGNPLAVAAGLAQLRCLQQTGFYEQLHSYATALCQGMREQAASCGVPLQTNCLGGMFGFFFSQEQGPLSTYEQVVACDLTLFQKFYHGCLQRGVYFSPSMYEAGFICSAHNDETLQQTLSVTAEVFKQL